MSPRQPHVTAEGRFQNTAQTHDGSQRMGAILWRFLTERIADKTPKTQIPVQQPSFAGEHDLLVKISHSTVLLRLAGEYFLTDPVFSHRASPLPFLGPKRFHTLPLTIEQLPELQAVLLSHDHYDHLDKSAIKALTAKTKLFVVPVGVDRHLRRFGVPAAKIHVLSWYQQVQVGQQQVSLTPAQHFSGRSLWDKNQTLWGSYVIESAKGPRIFFSGDSGYFSGFAEIAARFGPIDLALIETGAYDEMWPDIHMQPEQSLRAHLDLNAKYLLPIHNSSFDLAMHSWYEPLQRLAAASDAWQARLLTPVFGQTLALNQLEQAWQLNQRWWQAMMPDSVDLTTDVALPVVK